MKTNLPKKIFSFMLALILCVDVIPFHSMAAKGEPEEEWYQSADAEESGPKQPVRGALASPSNLASPSDLTGQEPEAGATDGSPAPGPQEPFDQRILEDVPYYLLLVHSLDIDGVLYGCSEVIGLDLEDFQDGSYDLRQHALKKEGMEAVQASFLDPETDSLEEGWTVSLDDFTGAGDSGEEEDGEDGGDGSAYYALQALMEYRALDGYQAVVSGESDPTEDPYGIMPLTSFEGGNIKDITFVPADVVTVRLQFLYSPTGGLAGMDAAESRVYQMKVPDVRRDQAGQVIGVGEGINQTWDLPYCGGSDQNDYPALENFRVVLDPRPLNEFLVDPDLAEEAMNGDLSEAEIQEALQDGSFTVNVDTGDSEKYVYQWQVEGETPPDVYEDYPQNQTYGNRYSDRYNQAWEQARTLEEDGFSARAVSNPVRQNQGANPLTMPELTVSLTEEQCIRCLNSAEKEISVTVYYRRNAGFYHVAHWVPKANLQEAEQEEYRTAYPQYNSPDPDPDSPGAEGFMMVYLERKQGRIGAMTSAQANPSEAAVLNKFIPSGFSQEEIGEDTCVHILYTTTEQYSLIFNTSMTYIPRQHIETANQVIFDGTAGAMTIIRDGEPCPVAEYHTPVRRGYAFLGWKYQVRSAADGDPGLTETENGQERYFKAVPYDGSKWLLDDAMISKAVIELTEETGEGIKVLNLYPVWNPSMASVRVVFWTEDLSGDTRDVCVEVNPDDKGGANYRKRVAGYLDTQPGNVGEHFSNAGSFTFLAEPNAVLDLQVTDRQFQTSHTGDFPVLDPDSTAPEIRLPLPTLLETMFTEKMPDAETSMTPVDGTKIKTSRFFYPYKTDKTEYTVEPDGSTVIHVYYARKVYELDFTYYGEITGTGGGTGGLNSGTNHTGPGGLVVATNTIGYSKREDPENFKYDYQLDDGNMPNRWQLVKKDQDNPVWQVPEKITISAKYDADLRNVWPMSNGETMELTLTEPGDLDKDKYSNEATFVSWGTTAGPFNQKYRKDGQESTLMGLYRSMGADIIANPDQEKTPHHLVAYWWNQFLSSYRRNACYEVPGLTRAGLVNQEGKSKYDDVIEYNIKVNREADMKKDIPGDKFEIVEMKVSSDEEVVRRNTLYLVPADHKELAQYFEDYRSNFMLVDEKGEPAEDGKYYALRCIDLADTSRVYALGRQAFSVSSNRINAQAPSTLPHMTVAKIPNRVVDTNPPAFVEVDHDTQTWDNWGQTAESYDHQTRYLGLGTPENPYDIWFYYDRARLTIHYMMPAQDSKSGEYELGTAEMIYGQSMKEFNVKLKSGDKNTYSNEFPASQWTPVDNSQLSSRDGRDLNKNGCPRVCPDSAVDGTGTWTFLGWTLDRSSGTLLTDADWNKTATGHMRVYGKWDPPAYQVRFDLNGGQYQDADTFPVQDVPANTSYTNSGNAIPQPVKSGYVLEGWEWYRGLRDAGGTLVPGGKMDGFQFETPFTQDMYVRAIWKSTEKETYNYKIWYLTDEPGAEPCEKPSGVSGEWLDRTAWGSLMPDPNPPAEIDAARFTRILGCEYYDNQEYARQVALAARPVSGYMPVKTSGFLTLDAGRNGTNPGNTRNVAYFYYRRNPDKTYQIRFQLYDRTGEEGILHSFTTQKVIADGTYFTPSEESSQALKEAGYQLVQMNADGSVVMGSDGQPLAARTYQELEAFIRAENDRFAGLGRGSEAVVTFKVMPIFYTIRYQVGTLTGGDGTAVRDAMQESLDQLCGTMVKEAVDAGRNPTVYQVCDFDGGYSFTLTNPAAIRNPENGDRWIFTGWSPAPGTRVRPAGRAVEGEYATLEIERSVGDLEFLANWELEGAPDDPDNPNTPDHPHRPGSSGDSSGGSSGGSSGSPSGTPSGTPGTPAPTLPSEAPQMPPAGQEEPPQLPDPNVPGAPDVVTVVEGSMSRTYRRFWDPGLEEWIYLLDGEIPLNDLELPKTGDTRNSFWLWFNLLSLSGLGIFSCLAADRRRKGKDSGNHR